ncbi:hypothetical protein CSC2_13290 [Clostridium zeae]|uniref:Lipoprotein n=1 Tax=Clostridium zeae TaxID=2759022 RepID=A0ABQ1E7R2_9CLOT|nr:hypothetical protein [Clostridium zeae]GFZ30803.1 hypothetical protein CSC2_13290 [Clostridium zeae]
MFKDVYKSANNKIPIKLELIDDIQSKISHKGNIPSTKHIILPKYSLATFLIIILCIIITKTYTFTNSDIIKNESVPIPQQNIQNGVSMSKYYRYNGSYYKLKDAYPDIQKNISKHLYDGFYEIKNMPSSKSIALFANGYYYRLDYTHKDTILFNNKSYLITQSQYIQNNPINDVTPGKYLGKVDDYSIYEVSDHDTSSEVFVKIGNDYFKAYQYLSYVELNGINYELKTEKNPISKDSVEEYIGMAGPYKAYRYSKNDITKSIVVHINDSEEVIADTTTLTDKEPLPVSKYGSDEESMFPIFASIQWRKHGIYSFDGETNHSPSKEQIGNKLDTIKVDNYSYELYEMKGEDTTKSIIVKNNKVYLRYNFMFADIIKFDGHDYIIGGGDPNHVKGEQIGTFGINKIYEFKGVDPSKIIDVFMSSSPDNTGLRADFTAYRQDD